jgi:hypothetical protein
MQTTKNFTGTVVVEGSDPEQAAQVLKAVEAELYRRRAQVAADDTDVWAGPELHLTVNDVDQLIGSQDADQLAVRRLFDEILRTGQKLGLTGVAYGPDAAATVIVGGHTTTKAMLASGVPLRYEATGDRHGHLAAALAGTI